MSFTGDTRSNQDIINYLHQKFVVEGVPQCAAANTGNCQYAPASKDQIGCAVGCLLSEEDQKRWDAGLPTGVGTMMWNSPSSYLKYFTKDQLPFLKDIQTWHDKLYLNAAHLTKIASAYNLSIPQEAHQ